MKPKTADGYAPSELERAKRAVLTLATYLGSYLDDLVIIGGLVPSFIVDHPVVPHVGTADVDIGLSLAILDESRYAELVVHLKSAGFTADVTSRGQPAPHRWKHAAGVTVDFLIAPQPGAVGDKRVISDELSAVHASALPLAFKDRVSRRVSGRTLADEVAERAVWFAGPASFLVLKALAFENRGENKDAYDLLFVLNNVGPQAAAEAFRPLLAEKEVANARKILQTDFTNPNALGPVRAADFVGRRSSQEVRADHARLVAEFLQLLGAVA